MNLTQASKAMFLDFAYWAPHYNGYAMVDVLTNAEKGNLTDLKKKGLLQTDESDGIEWVQFTKKGIELLVKYGVSPEGIEVRN